MFLFSKIYVSSETEYSVINCCSIGAIGVAMVEIDAETTIEMEVALGLIGVIIMETVLVRTRSLDIERFMYYELWAEGLIISVGWFLELEAKR